MRHLMLGRWRWIIKELGLTRNKTHVNGGAIALGHWLETSGARVTVYLNLV